MNSITKPSFSTCYYIRQVLQKHADGLKQITSQKSGFCASSEADLKLLLESVYLEDALEQLLVKLYLNADEISFQVQQLENLVDCHRNLVAKNQVYSEEFIEARRRIFQVLGFKQFIVKIEDLVKVLNQLSQLSNKYLGVTLTVNNLQATRPQIEWLGNFQVNRSADIVFSGTTSNLVTSQQIRWIQEWVAAFTKRSSHIIRDFATIIKQQKIGKLPEGDLFIDIIKLALVMSANG